MDAHLEVLLSGAEGREHARAAEDEEPPYVWWAKLKSPNRQQPLPHGAEVLALQAQIDEGAETHLYLTDYRSLYVALVDEITAEDVLSDTPGEAEHMPANYWGRPAGFWFRLLDIRRLVADDTVATIAELQKLRNLRYHDRPVSLYGGMVELPLILTREDGTRWFADAAPLTEGRLWAQLDAEQRGETERLSRVLRGARPSESEVSVEGRRLDLGGQVPHKSLGTLRNLLQHNEVVQRGVRAALPHDAAWLLGQLPYQLSRLAELRNPAAHSGSVAREAAVALRDEVVGGGRGGGGGADRGCEAEVLMRARSKRLLSSPKQVA